MAQQCRNPGGIFDIGLAAWHSLDVLRIHDKQFELAFKEIIDWTPIDACNLHRHVRTPRLLEPISQRQEIGRHGAEGADFLHGLWALGTRNEARRDGLFVHVEATAAGIHHVHQAPPWVMTGHGMLV